MLGMYGSRQTDVAQQVTGRGMEAGAHATAGLRTRGASGAAFTKSLGRKQASLMDALEAWGTDNVMNWRENGDQLMQGVQQELKAMEGKAIQARAAGDMEMYKLAMQQSLFYKQLAAQAKMMKDQNIGSIVSGIVGGLMQIGAGIASREGPQIQTEWRDYYGTNALKYKEPQQTGYMGV